MLYPKKREPLFEKDFGNGCNESSESDSLHPRRLEPLTYASEDGSSKDVIALPHKDLRDDDNLGCSQGCSDNSRSLSLIVADLPDDLARLVRNWNTIPIAIKTAINALLDATLSNSQGTMKKSGTRTPNGN